MISSIGSGLLETLSRAVFGSERLIKVNEDGTFQRVYR